MNKSSRFARIAFRLPLIMIVLALLNGLTTQAIAYFFSQSSGMESAKSKLETVKELKIYALNEYLKSIEGDLSVLAQQEYVRQAIADFGIGWAALTAGQTAYLQKQYIENNPNPSGKKEELDFAPDGSVYSQIHAKYHPWFRSFLREREYYDIFLFSAQGDVIYTVFKELDYATNMNTGQWKDTDLAAAFKAVRDNPKPEFRAFFDFRKYAPSNNVPASFIAAPVLDAQGKFMGAIAFQMPVGRINQVLSTTSGLGETGQVVLVGNDKLMRSQSRFTQENTILSTKFDLTSVDKALAGESGIVSEKNERGHDSLVSYKPLDFAGTRWALIGEMDMDELLAPARQQQFYMLYGTCAVLVIIALVSVFLARGISVLISQMVRVMKELAGGDLKIDIPHMSRRDEIGDMGKAVQVFKENALQVEAMQAEQERLKLKAEQDKKAAMHDLADSFHARTGSLIENLSKSADVMNMTAQEMSKASQRTSESSALVAAAATQADANVQTVAAASEELASSSGEIARQISEVASRASGAANDALATSKSVEELNTLATSIGEVVNAIKEIADQTNLLALNATIEAARAGAAGKGFAVVADEVKKLATETAKKTDEIDTRVNNIQNAIRESVEAMSRIISNVQQIDQATASVAGAVEEQNAATSEIGRNVTEASSGTAQVSQNIAQVQDTAEQTGQAASEVLGSARELKDISDRLRNEISVFLSEIRGDQSAERESEYRIAAE